MLLRQCVPLATLFVRCAALPWLGPQATIATQQPNSPSRPTEAAILDRRDDKQFPVTVCGWIGGRGDLQVTCKPHSSCVWQTKSRIVGCCATSGTDCGIYTSCVDKNAKQQSEDRKDVYTCTGENLCYLNSYPLGFHQWGCGKPKDATTVLTSILGYKGPATLQMVFTGDPAPPPETTSIAPPETSVIYSTVTVSNEPSPSPTPSPTSSTTSSEPLDSSTPPDVVTETVQTTPTAYSEPEQSDSKKPVGAIAGGTVGGIAGLALIGALIFFFLRSRRRSQPAQTPDRAELESPKPPQEMNSWSGSPVSEMETPKPRVKSLDAFGISRKAVPPPAPPQQAIELP